MDLYIGVATLTHDYILRNTTEWLLLKLYSNKCYLAPRYCNYRHYSRAIWAF